jgi:hypothetical protein
VIQSLVMAGRDPAILLPVLKSLTPKKMAGSKPGHDDL